MIGLWCKFFIYYDIGNNEKSFCKYNLCKLWDNNIYVYGENIIALNFIVAEDINT